MADCFDVDCFCVCFVDGYLCGGALWDCGCVFCFYGAVCWGDLVLFVVYLDCFYVYGSLSCVLDVDCCCGLLEVYALDLYSVSCSALHCYAEVDYSCYCDDECYY